MIETISEEATTLYKEIARNVVKLAELGYVRPRGAVGEVPPFAGMHQLMEILLSDGHILLISDNFEGIITPVSTSQKFDVRKFPIK